MEEFKEEIFLEGFECTLLASDIYLERE